MTLRAIARPARKPTGQCNPVVNQVFQKCGIRAALSLVPASKTDAQPRRPPPFVRCINYTAFWANRQVT